MTVGGNQKIASLATPLLLSYHFGNRWEHLQAYLARMHPMLRKQRIRYKIFIVDQVDEKRFNRAKAS